MDFTYILIYVLYLDNFVDLERITLLYYYITCFLYSNLWNIIFTFLERIFIVVQIQESRATISARNGPTYEHNKVTKLITSVSYVLFGDYLLFNTKRSIY